MNKLIRYSLLLTLTLTVWLGQTFAVGGGATQDTDGGTVSQYNLVGTGTQISSWITTKDDFAVADANLLYGGYHVVQSLSDMYAITYQRQQLGMLVYVMDEDKTYRLVQQGNEPQLIPGKGPQQVPTTAANWEEAKFGGDSYWSLVGTSSLVSKMGSGVASGSYNIVGGLNSTANGIASAAFGASNHANGNYSFAFGYNNTALGDYSLAFGNSNYATVTGATAFGIGTHAIGKASMTFGGSTMAEGENSVAMGAGSHAQGINSLAIGGGTNAIGNNSVAGGAGTTANGDTSFAFGSLVTARAPYGVAFGAANRDSSSYIFTVGNGDTVVDDNLGLIATRRSNAFTVTRSGNVIVGDTTGASGLYINTTNNYNSTQAGIRAYLGNLYLNAKTNGTLYLNQDTGSTVQVRSNIVFPSDKSYNIGYTDVYGNGGKLTLSADNNAAGNGGILALNAGGGYNSDGGDVMITAGGGGTNPQARAINTQGGDVTIDGGYGFSFSSNTAAYGNVLLQRSGGSVGIGLTAMTATNSLELQVNGSIGADTYCNQGSSKCFTTSNIHTSNTDLVLSPAAGGTLQLNGDAGANIVAHGNILFPSDTGYILGFSTDSGAGKDLTVKASNGLTTTPGGDIALIAGYSALGNGGDVSLKGWQGAKSGGRGNNIGGDVFIDGGAGGLPGFAIDSSSPSSRPGNVFLQSSVGAVGIGVTAISSSNLKLDVNGNVGADGYCDEVGSNCVTAAQINTVVQNNGWNNTAITNGLWSGNGTNVYRPTGNVGIGTNNPTDKLSVAGGDVTLTQGNVVVHNNGATAALVLSSDANSQKNIYFQTAGANKWAISNNADGGLRFRNALDSHDVMVLNPSSDAAVFYAAATFGGAVTAPAYYYSSDRRLKTNILPLSGALAAVMKLDGYTFDWKKDGRHDIGFIAQDMEQVYPQLVHTDDKGYKSVEYGNMVPVLLEAIKEQQKTIDTLTARVSKLEKQGK